MGWLNKLFGAATNDAQTQQFDSSAVRPALNELIDALGALAEAMDTPDAPLSNPGWRGRLRDVRNARGDLRLLTRRPDFERDDLYEVLTTVRPVYRGQPPKDFARLSTANERVISAIDALYAAAQ